MTITKETLKKYLKDENILDIITEPTALEDAIIAFTAENYDELGFEILPTQSQSDYWLEARAHPKGKSYAIVFDFDVKLGSTLEEMTEELQRLQQEAKKYLNK